MSIEEIISSGLLESYVLGAANADDAAMINTLCKTHPEILKEIEAIEASLIKTAANTVKKPNAEVKNKIIEALKSDTITTKEPNVIALKNKNETHLKLYQFAFAASLLLFVTSFIYNVLLQQKLGKLNGELSELYASKSYLTQEIKIQQVSIASINQRLQIVTNSGVKSITLNGMNTLNTKAAVVYWNLKTNEVYFNTSGLPDSPNAKQYQLWAIVDGKPVDAGVIDMSAGDSVFQKMKSIKGATAFAVTIEKAGGSTSPSLETMCLLGNV
jgi:anti-sigma-K factor RskA